jgi:hypothetical protein
MTIAFKSETHTTASGARVEVGTMTFQGRDFSARGSVVDEANGIVCGYPTARVEHDATPGTYVLTTWNGERIAPLRLVRTWQNRNVFGGFPVTMYAWSATINGRVYSGRNSGEGMFVCMRAGKVTS